MTSSVNRLAMSSIIWGESAGGDILTTIEWTIEKTCASPRAFAVGSGHALHVQVQAHTDPFVLVGRSDVI
jgi:hypothetical protein